jgi:hypothetical protein
MEVRAFTPDDWDGLIRFYFQIWAAAGSPQPDYHGAWMRDLGVGIEDVMRPAG